jgi:hypothetical protein
MIKYRDPQGVRHMKHFVFSLVIFTLLLTSCSPARLAMTERQQIGGVSFQSIEGYIVAGQGEDGIFLGTPDGEISIALILLPNEFFEEVKAPTMIGAEYPEEAVPFDILLSLGFYNIELQPIHRYRHSEFSGYSRAFISSSDFGDPIEGEWLFYTVGDYTFVALGSVVRVDGENRWDPQGKAAFDAILESVQFPEI